MGKRVVQVEKVKNWKKERQLTCEYESHILETSLNEKVGYPTCSNFMAILCCAKGNL